MKAVFIDCYRKKNKIILWLKKGKENIMLEDSFTPKIYVRGDDLKGIRETLQKNSKNSIKSRFVKKNTFFKQNIWVLEISLPLSSFYQKRKLVEKLLDYTAEIYNADIKPEEHYMFEKDIFPLAKVEIENKNHWLVSIRSLDNPYDIHYNIPDFSIAKIKVKTKHNLFRRFETSLQAISINNNIFEGDEKIILSKFKKEFEKLDPDIVAAEHGNLLLPFLKGRFKSHNLLFSFNRFENDDFTHKQGEHFHSYNKVVFRTHSIFLKGRLHFDSRSFFTDDITAQGVFDGARMCRQTIQRTQMRSVGAAITNLLIYASYKKDFLIPYKTGVYERFKTLKQLYIADHGSVIFEPRVGFHNHVAEFDFVSLYPNIMNKFNLSPETLFCRCCKDNKVPELHYNYCTRNRGIVSDVAKNIIERRIELKKIGTPEAMKRACFSKWLLVTMFGYQAFRNKKIGIIETHESIQAYARQAIMRSVRLAEQQDWEVIHGIIDSIYVKKKGFNEKDTARLGREIFLNTNLEINHEADYRWIVFLPSINDSRIPVPTHFYGVTVDNEIKMRGIEARRKDTPGIIVEMQVEMIKELSKAKDELQFRQLFPNIFSILKRYVEMLPFAHADNLAVYRSLRKADYANNIPQKIVVNQLKEKGYSIDPGHTIAYIIADINNRNPKKRYCSLEDYKGKFDLSKYTDMLVRATFSLLQPFDVTVPDLYGVLAKSRQLVMSDFAMSDFAEKVKISEVALRN
ncbi:MAG: DNA polymerase domain-containing protein [Candidatus Woesearchaeota archaeon]